MDDVIGKFTTNLKSVLTRALVFAVETGDENIEPVHLFWAVGTQEGCVAADILVKSGLSRENFDDLARNKITVTTPPISDSHVPSLSLAAKHAIEKAVLTATTYKHRYIGTEHLLGALLQINSKKINDCLTSAKADVSKIQTNLSLVFKTTAAFPDLPTEPTFQSLLREVDPALIDELELDQPKFEETSTTPALDYFTVELTNAEAIKKKDPLIGRSEEVSRLMKILSRRTKNNPILVGDPGVGKTAIVEGLATQIVEGKVPDVLADKRIYRLDLAALIAGTMYRGEFESRLRQLIDEITERPEIILFIDEVHAITGAGSASGSLDAANILKPALARGEIRCIGATTPEEYKKFIETDGALERRFQKIRVTEPNLKETELVLRGILSNFEKYHHVHYSEMAIKAALELAERYLTDKKFPDKAIDLIDEAGAAAHVMSASGSSHRQLRLLRDQLEKIRKDKQEAVLAEAFDQAVELKKQEQTLKDEIESINQPDESVPISTIEALDIQRVVAEMTGVPLKNLSSPEQKQLKNLEINLKKRVLGQNTIIETVSSAVKRAKLGLNSPDRPLASFLFTGPSGVGKTELAKALSDEVFKKSDAFLRLDMSEYSAPFTVSKLLGSPAGYVGYREGNKLTDHVKQHQHCLVLFDELEKAHPDVFNILLQILDQGTIADATGRQINFRNTMIVITSNEGSEHFERSGLGFASGKDDQQKNRNASLRQTLIDRFRRELINRLDQVCVFEPLDRQTLEAIAKKQLKELASRLESHGLKITFDQKISKLIAQKTDAKFGARDIRRIIEQEIEYPLAQQLLVNSTNAKQGFNVTIKDKGDICLTRAEK